MPKFSVIISVFNKEKHIKETIQSVLNQSFEDFEIVLVNDASTDGSDQVIQSITDDRITYIALAQNVGAGAARNKGISAASGAYIALLDGDDLWEATYLEEILGLTKVFPRHHVFATALIKEHKNGKETCAYSFENPENKEFLDLDFFESSFKDAILHSSCTVVHHSVFKGVGVYDPTIKSGQDTDLWIRIGMKYRVAFCTKPLVTYRYVVESLFNNIRSVTDRPDFLKWLEEEKTRPALKKYIDLNRYSLALRAKLWGESHLAHTYTDRIDLKNLNKKQRFLVALPAVLLKLLFKTNALLEKMGLRQSAF